MHVPTIKSLTPVDSLELPSALLLHEGGCIYSIARLAKIDKVSERNK